MSFENRRIARQVRADLADEFKVYLTDDEERRLAAWFNECDLDRAGTTEITGRALGGSRAAGRPQKVDPRQQ